MLFFHPHDLNAVRPVRRLDIAAPAVLESGRAGRITRSRPAPSGWVDFISVARVRNTAMPQGRSLSFLPSLPALIGLCALPGAEAVAAPADDTPVVILETSLGPITLELDRARAPMTVENFLRYVDAGHYNGTVFHRVIPGFMIQGGGCTADLSEKPTGRPVKNEAGNGVSNRRGTIAMARTSDPDSATAQFFINLADNTFLDRSSASGAGYTVFGRVIAGLDVVDQIAAIPTGPKGPFPTDVPSRTILITGAKRAPQP
jgi:cyclophilin family peptidyl-prolyl cis-trans isomerase